MISTLYHNLGIDTMNTTLPDPTGRPQFWSIIVKRFQNWCKPIESIIISRHSCRVKW
ncbi:MAG: hypothetical protein R3C11_17625 [Planctomycetaceae bacterium]